MSEAEPNAYAMELIAADIGTAAPPRAVILENVDWRVKRGEFWCVCGLHRSGKSDLLQTVAGLVPPLRGNCRLFGENDLSREEEAHRQVGLVFSGGRLFHQLTVLENVSLPVRYHRNLNEAEAGEEVEPILELTELLSMRHYSPGSLGRNWNHRIGLARALATRPKLLLLDEPLSGLDPQDVSWWLQLLAGLSKGHPLFDDEPMTILVTGDSFRPWKGTAHQFAVLKDRRFHALGQWPRPGTQESALVDHVQPSHLQL